MNIPATAIECTIKPHLAMRFQEVSPGWSSWRAALKYAKTEKREATNAMITDR